MNRQVRDTAMLLVVPPAPSKPRRFDQAQIGRRIRAARKLRGYTSAQSLGAAMTPVVEESTMLKKEKGVAPFTFEELSDICDILNAPTLFPFLDWDVAWLVERMLPPSLRAARDTDTD